MTDAFTYLVMNDHIEVDPTAVVIGLVFGAILLGLNYLANRS